MGIQENGGKFMAYGKRHSKKRGKSKGCSTYKKKPNKTKYKLSKRKKFIIWIWQKFVIIISFLEKHHLIYAILLRLVKMLLKILVELLDWLKRFF